MFFCFPGAKQSFKYSNVIDVKHTIARTNISGFRYVAISKITHFFNISESQSLKEETLIRCRTEKQESKMTAKYRSSLATSLYHVPLSRKRS